MYVAGHFRGWWSTAGGNSGGGYTDIGSTREGFRLITTFHAQPVISDKSGEGWIDGVSQGADNILRCDYIDYDLIAAAAGQTTGTIGKTYDNVGKLLTAIAGTLALKAAAGTTAETEQGAGNAYIFYRAVVMDDLEILLASKLRQGPLTFRLLPDPTTGKTWEKASAPGGVTS